MLLGTSKCADNVLGLAKGITESVSECDEYGDEAAKRDNPTVGSTECK